MMRRMVFREAKASGLRVVVSTGGVTVVGRGWTFDAKVKLPRPPSKLTKKQLDDVAKKAVRQYKKF